MLAGGNALEELAAGRARRELSELVARAPRVAHLRGTGGAIAGGARRAGRRRRPRARARRGGRPRGRGRRERRGGRGRGVTHRRAAAGPSTSAAASSGAAPRTPATPFELRAVRAGGRERVRGGRLARPGRGVAQGAVRPVADRYAIVFLPLTAVIAGLAWALSGDPVRALAVFVVATPCPLILAAPIALIAGISRAARAGVIVKGGGVIEQLGRARTVLLDKTGTVTIGTPEIEQVLVDGRDRPGRARAAGRVARPALRAPARRGARPRGDRPGPRALLPRAGDRGAGPRDRRRVDGRRVAAGSETWLRAQGFEHGAPSRHGDGFPGRATIAVAVDGRPAGAIVMGDHIREDARGARRGAPQRGHPARRDGHRRPRRSRERGRPRARARPCLSRARPGRQARGRPVDSGDTPSCGPW